MCAVVCQGSGSRRSQAAREAWLSLPSVPQRLKPRCYWAFYGTTEVVPFPFEDFFSVSLEHQENRSHGWIASQEQAAEVDVACGGLAPG